MPSLPQRPAAGDPAYRTLQLAARTMVAIGLVLAFLWACVPGETVVPFSVGLGGIALLALGAAAEGWLRRVPD
jgi:hypothetical protein